jgi:hypothetical protein
MSPSHSATCFYETAKRTATSQTHARGNVKDGMGVGLYLDVGSHGETDLLPWGNGFLLLLLILLLILFVIVILIVILIGFGPGTPLAGD